MPQSPSDEIPAVGLGVLCDRAGVQHEQIGRLSELHQMIAIPPQAIRKQGGFSLVQAASDGME